MNSKNGSKCCSNTKWKRSIPRIRKLTMVWEIKDKYRRKQVKMETKIGTGNQQRAYYNLNSLFNNPIKEPKILCRQLENQSLSNQCLRTRNQCKLIHAYTHSQEY